MRENFFLNLVDVADLVLGVLGVIFTVNEFIIFHFVLMT